MDALGINLPGQIVWLLLAIFLALLGGVGAFIARYKGMNGYLGFILGLGAALGLIILAIVL